MVCSADKQRVLAKMYPLPMRSGAWKNNLVIQRYNENRATLCWMEVHLHVFVEHV